MLHVDLRGLGRAQHAFKKIGRMPEDALRQLAQWAFDEAEQGADRHTDTGAMRRSTYQRRLDPLAYEIGHNDQEAPHAKWVHWGTPPHVIKPKNKKALRWPTASGQWAFAKSVHHPGYKGDPWMAKVADDAPKEFADLLEKMLNRI